MTEKGEAYLFVCCLSDLTNDQASLLKWKGGGGGGGAFSFFACLSHLPIDRALFRDGTPVWRGGSGGVRMHCCSAQVARKFDHASFLRRSTVPAPTGDASNFQAARMKYSFLACLGYLTMSHASLSRRGRGVDLFLLVSVWRPNAGIWLQWECHAQ